MLNRRDLIKTVRAGLAACTLPIVDASAAQLSLAALASRRGIRFGTAIGPMIEKMPAYADLIIAQCGVIVPEYEMKWQQIEPSPGIFDFTTVDRRLGFAQGHGMSFRGHTMVWHQGLPSWLTARLDKSNARVLLTRHITSVASRYAGRLHAWDVVNEPLDISTSAVDGLRSTPWLRLIGPDYLQIAFEAAASADPAAMLVLNDYGLIYDSPAALSKRTAALKLLERLVVRNVPVHALGLQCHLDAAASNFDPEVLRKFCRDVAALGLKIIISELDVADQGVMGEIAQRDAAVAAAYSSLLDCVLEEPAIVEITTWGMTDLHSWLSIARPRPDGRPVRPLPYDSLLQKKPAWTAIANALAS